MLQQDKTVLTELLKNSMSVSIYVPSINSCSCVSPMRLIHVQAKQKVRLLLLNTRKSFDMQDRFKASTF